MKKKILVFLSAIFMGLAIVLGVTGSYIDTTGVQVSAIRGTSLAAQWTLIDDHIKALYEGYNIGETYCTFDSQGLAQTKAAGAGVPTGTAGDENLLLYPEAMFEYHIIGTQTIVQPAWVDASGLNIAMDQADNDGIEITEGITASNKSAYVVGTDAAFYFKVTLTVADVTGADDLVIGFRKAEAYQAGPDAYADWAAFNIIQGVINTETELAAGGTVTTDTTLTDWVDTKTHTLQVNVSATGAVTYLYDGAEPTTVVAFSFADGAVVVPFIQMIQHGDLTGVVTLGLWECGHQSGL